MSGHIQSRDPAETGFSRFSGIQMLVTLLLLFLAFPFFEKNRLAEIVLFTLVLLTAGRVVSGKRRTLWIAIVLLALALAGKWIAFWRPEDFPAIGQVPVILFLFFAAARLLQYVLCAQEVDARVLCAGLSGYLILGITWMPLYILTDRLIPNSFLFAGSSAGGAMEGFQAFYFSFVTLCTVGYGDITPASNPARMLVVLEAVAGLFYVAVILARLVALYSSDRKAEGKA